MTTANAEQHELMRRFGDDFTLSAIPEKVRSRGYRQPSKKALSSGVTRRSIERIHEQRELDKQFEL